MGSTVQEDIDAANMGIMAKLKKLQKERLIVARLGFPDKAMEIDEHIEKIRADLRVRSSVRVCYCRGSFVSAAVYTVGGRARHLLAGGGAQDLCLVDNPRGSVSMSASPVHCVSPPVNFLCCSGTCFRLS